MELLDNPDATLAQLTKHVKGPDFPTSAEIITPPAEIREMYKTGNGSSASAPSGKSRTARS